MTESECQQADGRLGNKAGDVDRRREERANVWSANGPVCQERPSGCQLIELSYI